MASIPVASAVYSTNNIPMAEVAPIHLAAGGNLVDPNPPLTQRSSQPIPSLQYYNLIFNEVAAREYLSRRQWPVGLQDTFIRNLSKIPLRFFICDDSGSMITSDGHKIAKGSGGETRVLACSRWSELTEALQFHAGISHAARATTEFRLLNGSAPIIVGMDSNGDDERAITQLHRLLEGSPSGGTPLCRHIREVVEKIRVIEPILRANQQRACVMIATDGESSDGDVAEALRPLQNLPVWVVVRLCTDDEKIVSYWNNIDKVLELDMDVLDDLFGEAAEVYENNKWLAYGEPMHRLREFGIPVKEIDLLDESVLSLDQIRLFCQMIYGGPLAKYPDPQIDWPAFAAAIREENSRLPKVWSPYHKSPRVWVDPSQVASCHRLNSGGCNIL
eukprot:gene23068-29890_t